ncbi:hypothetical protein J1614_002849 [Plenodomus biglobosus]|nr:hypothetical protein J1614_002849 [Plenodomus biglobosus]
MDDSRTPFENCNRILPPSVRSIPAVIGSPIPSIKGSSGGQILNNSVGTTLANQLCEKCVSLNLSVEKFVIEYDKAAELLPSLASLRLANERFYFGTLSQIRTRHGTCSLCSLVAYPMRKLDLINDSFESAECHLTWEMDGRMSVEQRGTRKEKRTRRLRVTWDGSGIKRSVSYLVLAAPKKYENSDFDYPKQLNHETQFLGRRFGAIENKKNLIREFLELCETNHDHRCTQELGIEGSFFDTLMEPYFGVIDIEKDSLVPLPVRGTKEFHQLKAYAAISYVWGENSNRDHRTTTKNIQSRRKSGGLAATIQTLPKSLRQSIRLVHDLGIRYVWIDALCIVQDSSHSWNLNARAMHLIYGNATLTVCAADGDAETGLLALDQDQRPKQQSITYAKGVNLILHQPPEMSIQSSKWNKRAWTFQERLLSKRCLIFTGGQVYFQCRSTVMSEDIFTDKLGRGWSLDLVQAPLQLLSELKQRSMWFYAHCVSLYTLRELYHPLDILAAFSGMCKLMESTMQAPFTFGLPTSHFDLALLWEPVDFLTPLDSAKAEDDPKYKDLKFPSWSWCGWKSDGIQYKSHMVDGCFADVHAWLSNHTWIDWHIRDGHGTLRRLWDRRFAVADQSTDEKWTGYDTLGRSMGDQTFISKLESSDGENAMNAPSSKGTDSPWHITPYDDKNRRRNDIFFRKELEPRENVRGETHDNYGRRLQGGPWDVIQHRDRLDFQFTLPEDPYHVKVTEHSHMANGLREFPDRPFLQFFTWRASFHVVRSAESRLGDDVGKTRTRCHIIDRRGDKCGSIIVNNKWLEEHESGQTPFRFIAISDAKSFSQQEFPVWTYYLPKERIDSEWDLYFVLLVEHYPEEGIYRRVALGKVFKAAFTFSDCEWKEIILG